MRCRGQVTLLPQLQNFTGHHAAGRQAHAPPRGPASPALWLPVPLGCNPCPWHVLYAPVRTCIALGDASAPRLLKSNSASETWPFHGPPNCLSPEPLPLPSLVLRGVLPPHTDPRGHIPEEASPPHRLGSLPGPQPCGQRPAPQGGMDTDLSRVVVIFSYVSPHRQQTGDDCSLLKATI